MDPPSPFDALDDPSFQLGQSELLLKLGNWKFLPKGAPGEVEVAADLLGLRLVGNLEGNAWGTYYCPFASFAREGGTEVTVLAKEDFSFSYQSSSSCRSP
jgi:hypothetical protein